VPEPTSARIEDLGGFVTRAREALARISRSELPKVTIQFVYV
jgi:hypothetical protein